MSVKKLKSNKKVQAINPLVSIKLSVQSDNNIKLETRETLQLQPEKMKSQKFDRMDPMQTSKDFLVSPLSSFFYPLDSKDLRAVKQV